MALEIANSGQTELLRRENVEDFFIKDGILEQKLEHFVPRLGQKMLSEAIHEHLGDFKLLIAEAGTGTGKTFAYLIPALLSDKVVLISTASKALQDQLSQKDLPKIFALMGMPPDFMALKGFSNYLCRKRYHDLKDEFLQKHSLDFDEDKKTEISDLEAKDDYLNLGISDTDFIKTLDALDKIVAKADHLLNVNPRKCDFAEVNSLFSKEITSKICCDRNSCLGKKCEFFDSCFPFAARQAAINSKVVVINHSLFFSLLGVENPFDQSEPAIMLPKYGMLIFDEAHELPDTGREHLSFEISSFNLKKLEDDCQYIIKQQLLSVTDQLLKGLNAVKQSYAKMFSYLSKKDPLGGKRNILEFRYDDFDAEINDPFFEFKQRNEEFRDCAAGMYQALKSFGDFLHRNREESEEFLENLSSYVLELADNLVLLMTFDNKNSKYYGKYVGAVETTRHNFYLTLTPLEISEIFGKFLASCYSNNIAVLMTSATLSVDHKFDKFMRDIGASPDKTVTLEVPSGFHYKNQASLFVSKAFPSPQDPNRIEKILLMLNPVISAVDGGTFFLTTSYAALLQAYEGLLKKFGNKRLVMRQNLNLSNSKMLEKFRQDGHGILVGTSSFWAGVDVPGKALSLVIIDKLPFASPSDPVYKARCDYFDANHEGLSSFAAISIPEAVIELRQGAGRLIRHETDRGIMIICDPRLESRGYGKIFMRSLPEMNRCTGLSQIIENFKYGEYSSHEPSGS